MKTLNCNFNLHIPHKVHFVLAKSAFIIYLFSCFSNIYFQLSRYVYLKVPNLFSLNPVFHKKSDEQLPFLNKVLKVLNVLKSIENIGSITISNITSMTEFDYPLNLQCKS